MPEQYLQFEPGMTLQLQPLGDKNASRDAVKLLGYCPERSLVVTTPSAGGKMKLVREGKHYAVRFLQGHNVLGFTAAVLASYAKPYPHLHLSFPREFESSKVRNAERASADIGCEVRRIGRGEEESEDVAGSLVNLSVTGARLLVEDPHFDEGDRIQISFRLHVAGDDERIRVFGTVRSTGWDDDASGQVAGVQFANVNRLQQLLLHGWVLERQRAESSSARTTP